MNTRSYTKAGATLAFLSIFIPSINSLTPDTELMGSSLPLSWSDYATQAGTSVLNTGKALGQYAGLGLGTVAVISTRENLINQAKNKTELCCSDEDDASKTAAKIGSAIGTHYLCDVLMNSTVAFCNSQASMSLLSALQAGYGATSFYNYDAQALTALGALSVVRAVIISMQDKQITSPLATLPAGLAAFLAMRSSFNSSQVVPINICSMSSIAYHANHLPLRSMYMQSIFSIAAKTLATAATTAAAGYNYFFPKGDKSPDATPEHEEKAQPEAIEA
jgi:hypothetical protein